MNLVEDATFIMDSMNLRFLCTLNYSPLSSPVGAVNVASRQSFTEFKSTCLHHLVLFLSSLTFSSCFRFELTVGLVLSSFVFLSVRALSRFSALYLCWYRLVSYFFSLSLRDNFQVMGGRLSLYNFSRLPLIIPLSYVPSKSFNCTSPPSMKIFTSYGPNQCLLIFLGC
jgi:hypothetical protein